jgi:CheY-like chemotaxis protein
MNSTLVILGGDNEELTRQSITVVVGRDGYQLLTGSDRLEAVNVSSYHGCIDLLISDIQMLHMTGSELTAVLAKERPTINVLLVSGSPGEETTPKGLSFRRKPFRPNQLRQAILNLVGGPEGQKLAG